MMQTTAKFQRLRSSLILAGVFSILSCNLHAQSLEVTPNRVLMDESSVIRVSGLQPKERITLQSSLVDGANQTWTAQADFVADGQGNVDVSKQAPVGGSYPDVSAMGLIWSMRPTSKEVSAYRAPANFGVEVVDLRLLRNGQLAASARLERAGIAAGVRRIAVTGPVRGVLVLPNTTARLPAVLVVGGSEGGVPIAKAVWLASHGYAALALAYFGYADLPRNLEAIPLEYFGKALDWMMQRPEIMADRIAVVGTSRGGELALQLGSMFPQIRAVVAYVPANLRAPSCCGATTYPYAWTWQGQPLTFAPTAPGRNPIAQKNAEIKVEFTQGPVLMISGQDDGVWASSAMADAVMDRLRQARFPFAFQHLKYPHAGHMAGMPEIIPAWRGTTTHPISGKMENFGGTPSGNAQSSLDAGSKVLEFLRTSIDIGASDPRNKK